MLLFAENEEKSVTALDEHGEMKRRVTRRGMEPGEAREGSRRLESGGRVSPAKRLRWRLRYFSDGVVIGSRGFVEAFLRVIADGSGRGARALRGGCVVTLRH